jgi:hypothetical protein
MIFSFSQDVFSLSSFSIFVLSQLVNAFEVIRGNFSSELFRLFDFACRVSFSQKLGADPGKQARGREPLKTSGKSERTKEFLN